MDKKQIGKCPRFLKMKIDNDMESILKDTIRDIFECKGEEQRQAIDAFFELTKDCSIPSNVEDKILYYFKNFHGSNDLWRRIVADEFKEKFDEARNSSDFSQFLAMMKHDRDKGR